MKKIKLLRIVLVLLLLWYTVYLGYSFWPNILPAETTIKWQYVNLLQFATYFVLVMPAVILVIGALNKFIKSGYFNLNSARLLKAAGILLIINAVAMQVARNIAFADSFSAFLIIVNVLDSLLPLSFGIGLWAVSDYICRSIAIEKENQLTI